MSFIKNFSSLDIDRAFKTLFPTVNEEGEIVFKEGDAIAFEGSKRKVLDVFSQHIHPNKPSASAGAVSDRQELSLEDRRQWFKLIEQVEKMSNSSSFCKELLDTVQNFVLGRIFSDEEIEKPVDIPVFYKDIKNSGYLKGGLLGEYKEGYEGVITTDVESAERISRYLENRENLENVSNVSELILLHETAGFLGDDEGKEKILFLIEKKIKQLPLKGVLALLPDVQFYEIQKLLEDRISALAPKAPPEAILNFFTGVYQTLGDFSKQIRSLSFEESRISPRFFGQIVDLFPFVDTIALVKCEINDRNFPGFLQHLEKLSQLRSLDICLNEIGPLSARLLANKLVTLEILDIASNEIGVEGARAVASLPKLEVLDISTNRIGDLGAKALGMAKSLKSLTAAQNSIFDEGAKALAALENLESLDLSLNEIGNEGLIALADKLIKVESLIMFWNKIGDEGVEALADKMVNIRILNLSDNDIENEGAIALAKLKKLKILNVSNNYIENEGARALNGLENLEELDITRNRITSKALWESIRSSKNRRQKP